MQLYKTLLLFLLVILITILLKIPESSEEIFFSNLSYTILNFDLSFRILLISFLLAACIIVISAKNISFSEMLFLSFYTVSLLCAVLLKEILFTIVFCELMSISASFVIAISNRDKKPAVRYACIHFFSGTILTIGLSIQSSDLMIIGLLINCACFPFSFWVIDAYPIASLHSSLYLSLLTTKVSFLIIILHIYSTWRDYAEITAFLGASTAVYGIIFTYLEQNIRKFLAYSFVAQMGTLIMTGSLLSGSENSVPLLTLSIIFSVVYQLLFATIVSKIILYTKAIDFDQVKKSLTLVDKIYLLIAIFTIAAFPGTIGFISKSYIAAVKIQANITHLEIYKTMYKILDLLIYLSIGIKFLNLIFIAANNRLMKSSKGKGYSIVTAALAAMCIIFGNPYFPIYNKSAIFDLAYNKQNVLFRLSLLLSTTFLFVLLHKLLLSKINFFRIGKNWSSSRAPISSYTIPVLMKLISNLERFYLGKLQNFNNFFTNICYTSVATRLKEALNYNSVSFVSASSLFLMGFLLVVLLCLNH